MATLYDIHVHLADPAAIRFFAVKRGKRLMMRLLLRGLKKDMGVFNKEKIGNYSRGVVSSIDDSILDYAVLLALDHPHDEDGKVIGRGDAMVCTNDYIASLCATSRKALFGASIHPYRGDARRELERCIRKGACLVKWVPSAQNIDPLSKRCLPFYEMLAANRMPLLCHTGIEHILSGSRNELNDPARLLTALKCGVTVIAAHCGARMLLHERSYFETWRRMTLEHENFYGDISAFVIPTRMHILRRLLNDEELRAKVLYGSDFPGFPDMLSCLPRLGFRRTKALFSESNPFNRHVRTVMELGLPGSVFSRAGELLRICNPPEATA